MITQKINLILMINSRHSDFFILNNHILTVSITSNMAIDMYAHVMIIWVSFAAAETSTGTFWIHISRLTILVI